jgi:hypothetical protein
MTYKANRAILAGLVMLLVSACADRTALTFAANSGPNVTQRRDPGGVVQTLLVAKQGAKGAHVDAYVPPYLQRKSAIPVFKQAAAMASDSKGDLFIVEGEEAGTYRLRMVRPPYDRPVPLMPLPAFQGLFLATNANLFVGVGIGKNKRQGIAVYASPYTRASKSISILKGLSHPTDMVMDRQGDLIVSDSFYDSNGQIVIYPPPYDGTGVVRIPAPSLTPKRLAVDSKGDIFATNYPQENVYEFSPPYSAAPRVVGPGTNIAVNSSDELFVSSGRTIAMYSYPYTTSTLSITAPQLYCPGELLFDDRDDLFVAQGCAYNVAPSKFVYSRPLLYEPPYTSAPSVIAPEEKFAYDLILAPSTAGATSTSHNAVRPNRVSVR